MSHKDNQDLRVRDVYWSWEEHELYTVFAPLIGPLGIAVYKAFTRLVPLSATMPDKYSVNARSLAQFSCVGRTAANEQAQILYKLGMVTQTKYLDGRDPSYQLNSLRELAKVGMKELKSRIGVRETDAPPFDQEEKALREKRLRKQRRRKQAAAEVDEREGALFDHSTDGVRDTDATETEGEDLHSPEMVSAESDHVSAKDDHVSADGEHASAKNVTVSATKSALLTQERNRSERNTPLPPASLGEMGDPDPDAARPVLPVPDQVWGDPGFEPSLAMASMWAKGKLGISKRGFDAMIAEQLRMRCKVHRSETVEEAVAFMVRQGLTLHRDAALMRHPAWGWKRFIGEGIWQRPLPYRQQEVSAARVGIETRSPAELEAQAAARSEFLRIRLEQAAEKIARVPAVAGFAAQLRGVERNEFAAMYEQLEQIEVSMLEALQAAYDEAELKELTMAIDAEFAAMRKQYPGFPEKQFDQAKGQIRRRWLLRKHDLPALDALALSN